MPDTGDEEQAALRARLSKLSGDLKAKAASHAPPPSGSAPPGADGMGSAMAMGLRAGSEFVAAIIVGAGIGWGSTAARHEPAFLIVFFMLGVAAGVWNVIRVTSPKGGAWPQFALVSCGSAG